MINTETNFSPGKYFVIRHNWSEVSVQSESGYTLCTSNINDGDVDENNQEELMKWQDAQMALFATSSEMYNWLQSLLFQSQMNGMLELDSDEKRRLNTLLAKARGENNE